MPNLWKRRLDADGEGVHEPMQPIDVNTVRRALEAFEGAAVYVHAEVTPGAFVRNICLTAERLYIAGEHPFRVALRFGPEGWIRAEGLTHYVIDGKGRLLMAGHDEHGRITTALELSRSPFSYREEASNDGSS